MRKLGFYIAIVFALVFSACSSGGGGSSSDGGTTNNTITGITITAVDGYIKDATLKDASGQVATYSGSGGKYTFSSTPTYPLTLTGGKYEDTNASFDINMTCNSGTVISPITTFLENNSTVLAKLANLALSGNPAALSDFSVDYIDTNNTDLAKLAQLLYVVLQDANLTKTLRSDMNVTSLTALYMHIESDINTTITDATRANNMRVFIQKVRDINSSVSLVNYETTLKNFKEALSLPNITWKGKTYGQVISPFTGKVWLDRNLGASQVCTALDDTECYGDYYQWGRGADGHEKRDSNTTSTQASDLNNTNTSFITSNNADGWDWTTADGNGSLRAQEWSKTDGTSICPVGYRVPTIYELIAEIIDLNDSNKVNSNTDAFNNFLKLPSAGLRYSNNGSFIDQGSVGYFWGIPVNGYPLPPYLGFGPSRAWWDEDGFRTDGESVRCLRD